MHCFIGPLSHHQSYRDALSRLIAIHLAMRNPSFGFILEMNYSLFWTLFEPERAGLFQYGRQTKVRDDSISHKSPESSAVCFQSVNICTAKPR